MDIGAYKNKFIAATRKQSKEQILADEIWTHFSKKIKFSMLMRLIKLQGVQAIRELFTESVKSNHPDHLALFLWKVKNNKVIWKT